MKKALQQTAGLFAGRSECAYTLISSEPISA